MPRIIRKCNAGHSRIMPNIGKELTLTPNKNTAVSAARGIKQQANIKGICLFRIVRIPFLWRTTKP